MNKEPGVRVFRPAVMRACLRALEFVAVPTKLFLRKPQFRFANKVEFLGVHCLNEPWAALFC